MFRFALITYISFLISNAFGQRHNDDPGFFQNPHGPHITEIMTIVPGLLGPNALPVPEIRNGRIGDKIEFEAKTSTHWMPGDNSVDQFFRLYIPIAPHIVAVECYGVALEYYRCSNEVRDQRQIRLDDTGWSIDGGDIYIATHIQVIKDRRNLPDVALDIAIKTTTGDLWEGRYSDTPANFFNAYFGKKYPLQNSFITEISFSGMVGFYVWQTNRREVSQDEGPLVGLENEIRMKNFAVRNAVAGYFGYETTPDNRDFTLYTDAPDQPMVYRGELRKYGKKMNWTMRYEHGFRDFPYDSFSISATWLFDMGKWYERKEKR